MRRLIFIMVILAALVLGAEIALTLLSQWGMEKALRAQYGLPSDLEVRINSFPYLVSLFRNRLGEVRLDWRGELEGVAAGKPLQLPYDGRASLYDLELNMLSILKGRLEIRSLSRIKAFVGVDVGGLKGLFGGGDDLQVESVDGFLAVKSEGDEVKYKVKVTGASSLTFFLTNSSGRRRTTLPEGESDIEGREIMLEFTGLPLEGSLEKCSLEGGKLVLYIGIPFWEGYLDN